MIYAEALAVIATYRGKLIAEIEALPCSYIESALKRRVLELIENLSVVPRQSVESEIGRCFKCGGWLDVTKEQCPHCGTGVKKDGD